MKHVFIGAMTMAALAPIIAAFQVRRPLVDVMLLFTGGAVGLACIGIWLLEIFGPIGKHGSPALVIASLAVSPFTVYAFAVLFGVRYFFTPVTGWPRAVYLFGAVAGLGPIILIVGLGLLYGLFQAIQR